MHLWKIVVHACLFKQASLIVLVDFVKIDEHLSVDVLRALHLMVVKFGGLENIIHFVDQWGLDLLKFINHF